MKTASLYVLVVVTVLAAAIALFGLLAAGADDAPAADRDAPRAGAMAIPF